MSSPAGIRPSSNAIRPSRLASPTGLGATVLRVIPSSQPESSTRVASAISRSGTIVNRDMK